MIKWLRANYPALCEQFGDFVTSEEYADSELTARLDEYSRDCSNQIEALVGRELGNKISDDLNDGYYREFTGFIHGYAHATPFTCSHKSA